MPRSGYGRKRLVGLVIHVLFGSSSAATGGESTHCSTASSALIPANYATHA